MLRRTTKALVWITAVGVALAAWALVARQITGAKPVSPGTRPNAIVWGDRVFQSPSSLARWLRSRGASYRHWSEFHRGALATVSGTRRRGVSAAHGGAKPAHRHKSAAAASARRRHARKSASATPVHQPARAPALRAQAPAASVWFSVVEALLLFAALLLVTAGVIPVDVLRFRGVTPPSAAARVYLLGAGVATGTGVLAAMILG